MEVSVLPRVVALYQYFLPVGPVKQAVRHCQGDDVLESRLLGVRSQVQHLATVQGYGYHGVLNVVWD